MLLNLNHRDIISNFSGRKKIPAVYFPAPVQIQSPTAHIHQQRREKEKSKDSYFLDNLFLLSSFLKFRRSFCILWECNSSAAALVRFFGTYLLEDLKPSQEIAL